MGQISLAVLCQVFLREALEQFGQRNPLSLSQRSERVGIGLPFLKCHNSFSLLGLVGHLVVNFGAKTPFASRLVEAKPAPENLRIYT